MLSRCRLNAAQVASLRRAISVKATGNDFQPDSAVTRKLLEKFSTYNPSPLSIKNFVDFRKDPKEAEAFVFLRKELPIRLANMIEEMNLLPSPLLKTRDVQLVQSWYHSSFDDLVQFESASEKDAKVLKSFCDLCYIILRRHADVIPLMARGLIELRDRSGIDLNTESQLHYFLDRFYLSKISIRMLINQHASMFGAEKRRHTGTIEQGVHVTQIVRDAFDDAQLLSNQHYGQAPELLVTEQCCQVLPCRDTPIHLTIVPSHLHHIAFELLKNAIRATIESRTDEDEDLPPVRVLVTQGKHDVTIRISDKGAGIPRADTDLVFNYLYSTAPPIRDEDTGMTPMAGYGYGLPISRLYARYFQGDICLSSLEGYGTDAYIYLKNITTEAAEMIPVYNPSTRRFYSSSQIVTDWSRPLQHPQMPSPR